MAFDPALLRQKAQEASQRAEEATPGPWEYAVPKTLTSLDGLQRRPEIVTANGDTIASDGNDYDDYGAFPGAADCEFIAQARTDVPFLASALIDALDEIESERATLKGAWSAHRTVCVERDSLRAEVERLETLSKHQCVALNASTTDIYQLRDEAHRLRALNAAQVVEVERLRDALAAKDEFLEASVAVWREIDRLSAAPDGYQGLPASTDLRTRERAAWERLRDSTPNDLLRPLGKADWQYDAEWDFHMPVCSQVKGRWRCGNGPLTGEAIATGDCGDPHGAPSTPPTPAP